MSNPRSIVCLHFFRPNRAAATTIVNGNVPAGITTISTTAGLEPPMTSTFKVIVILTASNVACGNSVSVART